MKDNVKWILTLIAFILVGVMLAGIILGWFNKDEKKDDVQESEKAEVVDGEGNKLEKGVVYEMPKAMIFNPIALETGERPLSVMLHATVLPEDATFTEITWDVAFKNPASEWATDKAVNNYISLTTAENDTHTVTVSCLQPFGEQIILKAASSYNPEVTKTCTLDYVCDYKYNGVMIAYRNLLSKEENWEETVVPMGDFHLDFSDDGRDRTLDEFYTIIQTSVGTINPKLTIDATFTYNEEFYKLAVPFQNGDDWNFFKTTEGGNVNHKTFKMLKDAIPNVAYAHWCTPISGIGFCWAYKESAIIGIGHIDEFKAKVKEALDKNPDLVIGTVKVEIKDSMGIYETVTGTFNCKIDPETTVVAVESIEIDDEDIVFGG